MMTTRCPKCNSENTETARFCSNYATPLQPYEEIPVPTQTIEAPREELTTGSTFAERYQIIRELGKGGMGKVYRALDKKLNEEVAIKLIKPEIALDKKTLEHNEKFPGLWKDATPGIAEVDDARERLVVLRRN